MKDFTIFKSLAGIIPEPKFVALQEGECKLSRDIRLTTNSVQPLQRKTMRNLFHSANIKVVANKKTYLINATVDENLEIPPEVPPHARSEYFEIELKGTVIDLRSASQPGIIWGSSTLAGIYQNYGANETVPNMLIRDWPSTPYRGLFLYSSWMLGMMEVNDWTMMGDVFAVSRFNQIFIEFSSTPSTELFSPAGDPLLLNTFPEGHKLHQLKYALPRLWYSPRFDRWKSKKQYPYSVEKQNLQDLLLILRERELNIIPTFSMFAGNRIIPQKAPKLAARRPRGGGKEAGLCYSNELTWKFLELYFEEIFRAHCDGTPERVCIRLDDGFVLLDGSSVFCECKQCAARGKDAQIKDFVNLLKLIKSQGAKSIVLTDSQEARDCGLLGKTFVRLLKKADLFDCVSLLQKDKNLDSFGLSSIRDMEMSSDDSYFFRNRSEELREELGKVDDLEEIFLSFSYSPLEHEHLLVTGEKLWNKDSQINPKILLSNWAHFCSKNSPVFLADFVDTLSQGLNLIPKDFFVLKHFEEVVAYVKNNRDLFKKVVAALQKNVDALVKIEDFQELPTNQRATYYILRAHSAILLGYLSAALILAEDEGKKEEASQVIIVNMEIVERVVPEWMYVVPFNGLSNILKELCPIEEEPLSV